MKKMFAVLLALGMVLTRLTMAGRAPSRNAPSVAESPQNQHRRSAP